MTRSPSLSVLPPPSSITPSPPPLSLNNNQDIQINSANSMATLVASPPAVTTPPNPTGIAKRYRPAPAKTFQCRGYGDCRMVFSRSEHLARHIRKHTGERPFSCHCGKQFSRLDNLRQHAQTVHADKQDQNERMMRDLTSLHASMAAANKAGAGGGSFRGKRSQIVHPSNNAHSPDHHDHHPIGLIKQEDLSPLHHPSRPGTTAGYEGDHNGILYQAHWQISPATATHSTPDTASERPSSRHSFRDNQSFLAPHSPHSTPLLYHHQQQQQQQQQQQSFLPFSASFNFGIPDATRPGSSSNRLPPDAHARMLPPLSAVVSSSVSPPSLPIPPQSTQHVLPLSNSSSTNLSLPPSSFKRPSTANRPGTAPASSSYLTTAPAYAGGTGLVPRSELPFQTYGRSGELGSYDSEQPYQQHQQQQHLPASPSTTAGDASPFSWHPPGLPDAFPARASSPPHTLTSRKRAFSGADGPSSDDASNHVQEYDEYESESRPQSRRLSVMELCNDASLDGGPFLPSSRPATSTGLSTSTSALALVDRYPASSSSSLFPGVAASATASAATTRAAAPLQEFRGGRVSAEDIPTSSAPPTVLPSYRGPPFTSPNLSDDSGSESSPRTPLSPSLRSVVRSSGAASPAGGDAIPYRGSSLTPVSSGTGEPQHDQVRVALSV